MPKTLRLLLIACLLSFYPTPAPAAGFNVPDLTGSWAGTFKTGGPSGNMRLDIQKAGEGWKCELKISDNEERKVGEVTDCQVQEEGLSFSAEVEGAKVKFTGKTAGEKLSGQMEATEGENKISGSWELSRVPK